MSSCAGVSPIVFRAGALLPEGVTYTPRQGSSTLGSWHQPENWSGLCRELRHEEVSFYLLLLQRPAATRPSATRLLVSRHSRPPSFASQSLAYGRLYSYPTNL